MQEALPQTTAAKPLDLLALLRITAVPSVKSAQNNQVPMNTLYYGDNLKILREYIKDESDGLI